jgi:hypothetical protein
LLVLGRRAEDKEKMRGARKKHEIGEQHVLDCVAYVPLLFKNMLFTLLKVGVGVYVFG